ncbi:MAG: hypothetical protein ACIAS6_15045 [Phycisphaerales bacterium JB060]
MPDRIQHKALLLAAAVGLACNASIAFAQQRDDAPQARGDRPVLSGPQVRERGMPGVERGFSAGAQEGRRAGSMMVPPRVFRGALGQLMAKDAPLNIRLSSEQRERIVAHVRAFEHHQQQAAGAERPRRGSQQTQRPAMNDRRSDQADSDRSRMPEASKGRRDRGRPETDRPRREGGEVRRQGAENRRARANAVARLQNRVWAELSAAQQAHMQTAVDQWRAANTQEQTERLRERYRREIGNRFERMDQAPEQPAGNRSKAERSAGDRDLSGLRRMLADLPPEVQERARQRLRSIPQERREHLLDRVSGMRPDQLEGLKKRLIGEGLRESRPTSPNR